MRLRLFFALLLLVLALSACAQKTALTFTNATECGTATITLTDLKSGNVREYTVTQGERITVEITPNTEYQYQVDYPRSPDYLQCDTKRVATMLNKGQTVNVRLTSVLDEPLQQAPATAEAAATPQQ